MNDRSGLTHFTWLSIAAALPTLTVTTHLKPLDDPRSREDMQLGRITAPPTSAEEKAPG